jgi:hypothetical protein
MSLSALSSIVSQSHVIEAVALFNASHHDEAMRRVQNLSAACQQLDTLPCRVVDVSFVLNLAEFLILTGPFQSYLHVQLAIIDFRNGHYSEAADKLTASIATVTRLFLHTAHLEPRLKIFTLVRPYKIEKVTFTN